jgi:hypothetical protein
LRVEAEDKMPKFKIQMTNKGVRNTSPSTNNGHETHGHPTRTLSEGTMVFIYETHISLENQHVTQNPGAKTGKLRQIS